MFRKVLTSSAVCGFILIDAQRDNRQSPWQACRHPPLHYRDPARRVRTRSGGAVCARGKGHLVWVLTVSYPGGRTRQISLSAEQKPLVQQWLRNYRKLKATLERVCELNHKLLRPENHR